MNKSRILSIRYPDDGDLRVREVISRSKTRGTGKYPSWKMNRMIHWESPHELNQFRLLDANPAVLRFEENAVAVIYMLDGVEHYHVPDVKVLMHRAKGLVEVKTRADAGEPEVQRRTELMTRGLPTFGYHYSVAIAEDLASAPRLENALTLLRFGRGDIPVVERERLRRALARTEELSWDAILAGELGPRSRAYACRLMLEGTLRFDMNSPLCAHTVVTVVGRQGVLA